MGLAKASSSFAHAAGIDLPTSGFDSWVGSAEVSWAMPTHVKNKSAKKQKAGAAGGRAKAAVTKKPHTDTNAVVEPEAEERVLSRALPRAA